MAKFKSGDTNFKSLGDIPRSKSETHDKNKELTEAELLKMSSEDQEAYLAGY
jgi:hypothetical protein